MGKVVLGGKGLVSFFMTVLMTCHHLDVGPHAYISHYYSLLIQSIVCGLACVWIGWLSNGYPRRHVGARWCHPGQSRLRKAIVGQHH